MLQYLKTICRQPWPSSPSTLSGIAQQPLWQGIEWLFRETTPASTPSGAMRSGMPTNCAVRRPPSPPPCAPRIQAIQRRRQRPPAMSGTPHRTAPRRPLRQLITAPGRSVSHTSSRQAATSASRALASRGSRVPGDTPISTVLDPTTLWTSRSPTGIASFPRGALVGTSEGMRRRN